MTSVHVSFDAPLLTVSTKLKLLHRINMDCLDNCGPQIMQLSRIGTNPLAMIPWDNHLVDQLHCSHCPLVKAPHPQEPEASV